MAVFNWMVLGPNQGTEKISRYEMSQEQARKLRQNLSIFKDVSAQFKVAGTDCHGFTRERFLLIFLMVFDGFCMFFDNKLLFVRRQRWLKWKPCHH